MGWCSGTYIFDSVVDPIIYMDINDGDKKEIIKTLIEALWSQDWDCEYDSDLIGNSLVVECLEELGFEFNE